MRLLREVRRVHGRTGSVDTEEAGEGLEGAVDWALRLLRLGIGGEVRGRRWEVEGMVDIEVGEGGRIEEAAVQR